MADLAGGSAQDATEYVCSQCGPAPEGPEEHARRAHTWPEATMPAWRSQAFEIYGDDVKVDIRGPGAHRFVNGIRDLVAEEGSVAVAGLYRRVIDGIEEVRGA